MDTQTAATAEEKKSIEELITQFLEKLGVDGSFSLEQTDDEVLNVILETSDSGMVIGYHGEILEAMQLILSLMIAKKLGRYIRIALEVGDYRKNREEYLRQLAMRMKEKVIEQQEEQVVSSLKAWERRIIHLFLQDDKEVVSESVGEGRERVLVIKPR